MDHAARVAVEFFCEMTAGKPDYGLARPVVWTMSSVEASYRMRGEDAVGNAVVWAAPYPDYDGDLSPIPVVGKALVLSKRKR